LTRAPERQIGALIRRIYNVKKLSELQAAYDEVNSLPTGYDQNVLSLYCKNVGNKHGWFGSLRKTQPAGTKLRASS